MNNIFTLQGVAVKVVATTGYKVRKIHIGRMSKKEKAEFESFIRSVSPSKRPRMELVEGGKTVPGRYSPLNTYQTVVRMTAPLPPSSSVDICDLKFTYIAERDIVQAEVCQPAFQGEPFGANWFDAQTGCQDVDTVGEFPKLTLHGVLVIFHRDRPQFCHIGRMFNDERDRIIRR